MAEDIPLNYISGRGKVTNRKIPNTDLPQIPRELRDQAIKSFVKIPGSEAKRPPPRLGPPRPLSLVDAHHLKVAQAANRRPSGQSGTSPQGFQGVSPIQQSIGKAKAIVMASKLGGHDLGDLQEQMEEIRDDPTVSLQEFEHTLDTAIQNERNKPPEAAKPPGSVTISRGNGPNAQSFNEFGQGAERNKALRKPGETYSATSGPSGDSYTIGGMQPAANPALPPDPKIEALAAKSEKQESAYQREQLAQAREKENAAEKDKKSAEKAVGTNSLVQTHNGFFGLGASPDTPTPEAQQLNAARQRFKQAQDEYTKLIGTLPGAPGQAPTTSQGTPTPQNAAPAPQIIGSVTPTNGGPSQTFTEGQSNIPAFTMGQVIQHPETGQSGRVVGFRSDGHPLIQTVDKDAEKEAEQWYNQKYPPNKPAIEGGPMGPPSPTGGLSIPSASQGG